MGESTKIEWCDRTASPWHGCSEVHVGCDKCYAREMAKRNPKTLGVWGDAGTRVKSTTFIDKLRKWNRDGERLGRVLSVFPSICDPFEDRHELVPWREEMFAVADECPWIRLLLLTKRPENVYRMWTKTPWDACRKCGTRVDDLESKERERLFELDDHDDCWQCVECGTNASLFRNNVWIGTSVSDQATADKAIPELLKCRDLSPVLFVSAEPLVWPVELLYPPSLFPSGPQMCCGGHECGCLGMPIDPWPWFYPRGCGIDWVIVGGESGHGARPCAIEWIDDIRRQCQAANVPCFVKQLGSMPVTSNANLWDDLRFGKVWSDYAAGAHLLTKDSKGGDPSEWPERLRVREFPKVEV